MIDFMFKRGLEKQSLRNRWVTYVAEGQEVQSNCTIVKVELGYYRPHPRPW